MAVNKTSNYLIALLHALFYTLPFLFLTDRIDILIIIMATHVIIDHHRIAKYWVQLWGIGEAGEIPIFLEPILRGTYKVARPDTTFNDMLKNKEFDTVLASKLPDAASHYISFWLLVIVDNTMHLLVNHWALMQ
jgi:hypothetical protein